MLFFNKTYSFFIFEEYKDYYYPLNNIKLLWIEIIDGREKGCFIKGIVLVG